MGSSRHQCDGGEDDGRTEDRVLGLAEAGPGLLYRALGLFGASNSWPTSSSTACALSRRSCVRSIRSSCRLYVSGRITQGQDPFWPGCAAFRL